MKLVYLASPYSHKDPAVQDRRYEEITKIAAKLTYQYGYSFFLPITQSHNMVKMCNKLNGDFEQWRDIDLYTISKCDELWIVHMDGWRESIGVQEELKFARENGIPTYHLQPAMNYEETND